MKKLLLLITFNFALLTLNCSAQNKDSLWSEYRNTKNPDSIRLDAFNNIAWDLLYSNPDSSYLLGQEELEIARSKRLKKQEAKALHTIAASYQVKNNFLKAIEFYQQSLKIREELGDKKEIASSLANIGSIYININEFKKALEYQQKSFTIFEKIKNKAGMASVLNNIGLIYKNVSDFPKALEYNQKSLKLYQELDDKHGMTASNDNIGNAYIGLKDYSKALEYLMKSLAISKAAGDKSAVATTMAAIGGVYLNQKKYALALDYLGEAKQISLDLNDINSEKEATAGLYETYKEMGNKSKALENFERFIVLRDSILKEDIQGEINTKELQYEFDKKEAAVKAENEKQQAVASAESKKQKIIIWSVISGLLLVIVFAGFVFRSLRITRKQKNIIELQKEEVSKQKDIADSQRIIAVELRAIAEKQKEKIVDSITYAQRIQQSILMEESEIQNYLPECFIYFQPKDIVSGDFYWCSKIDDKIIIAAVDCTGHGVPGAFMSMIGNTLLNQIVNEKHITTPSEILRHLNLGIYDALHQQKDGALSDDGMDIALCCIDHKNKEVQYAGQNPLYVLSDNQIEVIKGDIYGIGGGGMIAKLHDPLKKKFTNHVIPIKKDMSIYLFTDGYMDQFGGNSPSPVGRQPASGWMGETVRKDEGYRKKFGSQKFKELLLSSGHLSMQKQKELITSAHAEWMGSGPQIDDILVIGIEL